MANQCANTLTRLDKSDLLGILSVFIKKNYINADASTFVEVAGEFNFEKVVPEPDLIKISMFLAEYRLKNLDLPDATKAALKDLVETNDWHEWRRKNWGTKHNAFDVNVSCDAVTFQTLWTPPIPIIAELSKLVGTPLRLTYLDEGAGICGEATFVNGEVMLNAYEDFDEVPDALRKELDLPDTNDDDDEDDDIEEDEDEEY